MAWLSEMAMRRKGLITEIAGVMNTSQSSCDGTTKLTQQEGECYNIFPTKKDVRK